jgi:hypothetical protein
MLGSCIVRYGVSVLRQTRSRSRGPGMGGGPRFSLGPASPTRVRARWLARGRFRARGPISSKEHFEDRHLTVPPPADHPRPMGWSSLRRSRRRCLTSPVAAAGTAPPDPCRQCSWSAFTLPFGSEPTVFHLRGLDRSAPTLAGATRPDRNAFGRVTHGRVLPRPPLRACHVDRELAQRRAPFSPRDRLPCVRQHAVESAPWPARARRLALRLVAVPARDASDRPLPSHCFVRVPVPHRFPVGRELSRALSRGSPAITSERFASAGRTRVILWASTGVFFPSGCVRPSLWHPCRVSRGKPLRSRVSRRPESCRGHRPHARVKGMACGLMTRDVFRPTRTVAPRRPFERPAPAFALTAAWPPHRAQSAPFHPRRPLRVFAGQAPVHASRCRRNALLWASALLVDFCNLISTHGHTLERLDPRTRVEPFGLHCSPTKAVVGCVDRRLASPRCGVCEPRPARRA